MVAGPPHGQDGRGARTRAPRPESGLRGERAAAAASGAPRGALTTKRRRGGFLQPAHRGGEGG